MIISRENIRKIALLARIELSPKEEERYAETISAVLDYMRILNRIDTSKVEPTAQVTGLINITREDLAVASVNKKELMVAMPDVFAGELKVPGVFAGDE